MKASKFQERFCECLKYSNVSQVELAKAVHVSKQCVNGYKSGRIEPSIDTLFLICEFLDVSADYLLGLTD